MSKFTETRIRYAPISQRIVLARFGKNPNVALETMDAMNDFLQTLVQYAFEGRMPAAGEAIEVRFGGGDEQFTMVLSRRSALSGDANAEREG